jgi:regulator of replication initiation timing
MPDAEREAVPAPVLASQRATAAPEAGPGLDTPTVLQLQSTAGNAAVVRLLEDSGPDPVLQQLEADWENPEYEASQSKFKGDGRPKGSPKERYLKLAPLYREHGIDRPLKWAHENIIQGRFFGHSTPMHVDLRAALEAAEADLRAQGTTDAPFRSCWAFNPRSTTRGGWSNHADGKAIDIDAATNPHLLDKKQKRIINAVTGMDITAANPGADAGMDSYDAIVEMSQRFQDRFTPEGMARRIEELEADEQRFAEEEKALGDQLAAIPRAKNRGRLTPEERKQAAQDAKLAKQLTKALKLKHAEVERAQARQTLLSGEVDRYAAAHAAAEKSHQRVAQLLAEIEELETEIDALEAQIEEDEKTLDDAPHDTKEQRAANKKLRVKIAKDRKDKTAKGKSRKAKQAAIAKEKGSVDTLHQWGAEGFMDLSKDLVEALKTAGLAWGGDWAGSKDFMHFEVPASS